MTAKTATPAPASAIKPASLWRAMAQATPKGARALFAEHAEALAGAYTGAKQIKNELTRTAEAYGLNPIFKAVLKACETEQTPAAVFEAALIALIDRATKAPAKAKTPDTAKAPPIVDLLGMLSQYAPADLVVLHAEVVRAIEASKAPAKAPEAPAKATKATKAPAKA